MIGLAVSYREEVRALVTELYGISGKPTPPGVIETSTTYCLMHRERTGEILIRRSEQIKALIERGPLAAKELIKATSYSIDTLLRVPLSASALGVVGYTRVSRGPDKSSLTKVYNVPDTEKGLKYADKIRRLGKLLLSPVSDLHES